MSFSLEYFGGTALPLYDATWPTGAGQARTDWTELAGGGAYDNLGGTPATGGVRPLHVRGDLVADSAAELQTAYDSIRARWGQTDQLFARMGDGSVRWCWATLARMSEERPPELGTFQPLDLIFEQISLWYSHWHGAGLFSDSGLYSDTGYYMDEALSLPLDGSGAQTISLPNLGNAAIDNAILTLAPSGGGITGPIGFSLGPADWSVAVNLSAAPLIVDTGAWSVVVAGITAIDHYTDFTLAGDHHLDHWLDLAAGATNPGTLTYTPGGAGVFNPSYWEGWQ